MGAAACRLVMLDHPEAADEEADPPVNSYRTKVVVHTCEIFVNFVSVLQGSFLYLSINNNKLYIIYIYIYYTYE